MKTQHPHRSMSTSLAAPARFLAPTAKPQIQAQEMPTLRAAQRSDGFTEANAANHRPTVTAPMAGSTGRSEGWRAAAGMLGRPIGAGVSMADLGRRMDKLDSMLGGAKPGCLEALGSAMDELRHLGLDSGNAALLMAFPGRAESLERGLLQTLAGAAKDPILGGLGEAQKMLAELLSIAQGRAGLSPHGFEPGCFGLPAQAASGGGPISPLPQRGQRPAVRPNAAQATVRTAPGLAEAPADRPGPAPRPAAPALPKFMAAVSTGLAGKMAQAAVTGGLKGGVAKAPVSAGTLVAQAGQSAAAAGSKAILQGVAKAPGTAASLAASAATSAVAASGKTGVQPQGQADVQAREKSAKDLVASGDLGTRLTGIQPPPTPVELGNFALRFASARTDEAVVALSKDSRMMELANPQAKSKLVKELISGDTNAAEESAIRRILTGCKSKDEMDQVITMSGGWEALRSELEPVDLKAVSDHGERLGQKQDVAAKKAIGLLEQAQSPEEFKKLSDQLGGDQLKHALKKPVFSFSFTDGKGVLEAQKNFIESQKGYNDALGRLEALGKKQGNPALGFGMPPEKATALQAEVGKALGASDCGTIVALSEQSEVMKSATPAQKGRMIELLQDGWTKDSQDMAISRILTSCSTKAEFDKVVDLAGGRHILKDVDFGQAKADINKLAGGFDRVDVADNKPLARDYQGIYTDPARHAALTKTRQPTDAELKEVLGPLPFPGQDLANPVLAHSAQALDSLRGEMGKIAHDLNQDPMARNKLAMVNRDRERTGLPALDYTSLVTKAYQAAHDPTLAPEVARRAFEKMQDNKAMGMPQPLKPEQVEEIRQEVLAERLGAVGLQFGLGPQDLKTLVTAKMGRVMGEGAANVRAYSGELSKSIQTELAETERTRGPQSAEATLLRDALGKLGPASEGYAERLEATGATAASVFQVPPSFEEKFAETALVVADVAATLANVIPGVGQAISGAYFGAKAVVSAAQGDFMGAFTNLVSALPGAGGAIGGKIGQGIKVAAKLGEAGLAVAQGDVLGVVTGLAGASGDLGKLSGKLGQIGGKLHTALQVGAVGGNLIAGAVNSDAKQILTGLGEAAGKAKSPKDLELERLDPASFEPTLGERIANGFDATTKTIDQVWGFSQATPGDLEALKNLPVNPGLGAALAQAAPLLGALKQGQLQTGLESVLGQMMQDGAAQALVGQSAQFAEGVASGRLEQLLGSVARGIGGLDFEPRLERAQRLLNSPELSAALGLARDGEAFLSGLASGALAQAVGGSSQGLATMLQGAASMARAAQSGQLGDLAATLGEGAPAARLLRGLDQLADGGLQGGLEGLAASLGRITEPLRQAEAKPWLDALDSAAASVQPRAVSTADALRAAGAGALAAQVEAFGNSPAAQGLRETAEHVAQLMTALGLNQPEAVGAAVQQWMPQLEAGVASESLAGLAQQAQQLLRALGQSNVPPAARPELAELRRAMEQVIQKQVQVEALQRFEQSAAEMATRFAGAWQALGQEMLQTMGFRL